MLDPSVPPREQADEKVEAKARIAPEETAICIVKLETELAEARAALHAAYLVGFLNTTPTWNGAKVDNPEDDPKWLAERDIALGITRPDPETADEPMPEDGQ